MSFYANIEAVMSYSSEGDFRNALAHLNRSKNWDIRVAIPQQQSDGNNNESERGEEWMIWIPPGHYRNLSRYLSEPLELADEGTAIGTSSDGCLIGWIDYANGDYKEFDLYDWINENEPELAERDPQTNEEEVELHIEFKQAFLGEKQEEMPDLEFETSQFVNTVHKSRIKGLVPPTITVTV